MEGARGRKRKRESRRKGWKGRRQEEGEEKMYR